MDNLSSSLPPIKNSCSTGWQIPLEEGSGELETIIDWLEGAFQTRPPDELIAARIRRKLLQEWKARKRFSTMVLLVSLAAAVGVVSVLMLMLAAGDVSSSSK